jgi:hypothetical protein
MFGMDALLSHERIPTMAKLLGVTAGRVDYDGAADKLYVSWLRHGRVECIEVPCGVTYTPEQIAELLKHHDIPTPSPDTTVPVPAAKIPPDTPCYPFGTDGPEYRVRISPVPPDTSP